MLNSWLEEYDDLVRDVLESNYHTFPLNVQRWLDFIDAHPLIEPHIARWEREADFKKWFAAIPVSGGPVGGNRLDWPRETRARLALQLGLFRAFGLHELDIAPFALQFFYVQGNFDVQVANITRRLFNPFVRELRREIQKLPLGDIGGSETPAPASDRVVALDHNSAPYHELIEALHKIEHAISTSNDYPEPESKERHVAEISAGHRLLKSVYVRAAAIFAVLGPPLFWLMKQFADKEIGHLADLVWKLITSLIGS